ncbi:MAG TPA: cysteine--tRNA ligase [Ruminococcaceae bacterium]|nr:cysteine--tRNA ligase [Oscillospiraceae bacterium]
MKIYNTLTRKKEEFTPAHGNKFKIYACGPTVYNYIHIGNARPLCVFDVLRRYLEWRGYEVDFVQNFTDIDDKLINRAKEESTTVSGLAEKYTTEYWIDANGLDIRPATEHPKATENIETIIGLISELIEKGYAYVSEDGVYFKTGQFGEYGKLSHQPLEELEAGARIEVAEHKQSPMDFVLWKAAKPGEPFWPSPFGDGRPGWHIECSAMAKRFLGDTIDIHCGGQDLIFPHHENEIAQSECANGKQFARYWMHNGYINVDNRKMSKSLGNFFTVRDVAKEYGYEPIRFLMISAQYRSPISYSTDLIKQSVNALERIYTCRENLDFVARDAQPEKEGDREAADKLLSNREAFINAMDDDLNTADAIAAIFDLVRDINSITPSAPSKRLCREAAALLDELCGVLGLLYNRKKEVLDGEVEEMIARRTAARAARDYALADKIRDELKERGILLEDTPQGVKWQRMR